MERRPYLSVAQERDPPLVSGRWRVLGAALRRAIASRRTVPADVKDQSYHPLHNSFQGNAGKVYPIPPPLSSGKCGFWKLREGAGVDQRPETGLGSPVQVKGSSSQMGQDFGRYMSMFSA